MGSLVRLVSISLLLISLIAPAPIPAQDYQDPAYQAAVADAAVALPDEIRRNLTAIVGHNTDLIWEGTPGASRVLVVSWLTGGYYDDSVGRDYHLPSWLDVWVTAAPELKNFFAGQSGYPGDLRLEQLLGLPPGGGKDRFVEMWVETADLFRPSPDPEITDQEAELDFRPPTKRTALSADYVEWFNNLKETMYSGRTPYPWTRLGYTYDWGSTTKQGLSEFIVNAGAWVGIKAVCTNREYFRD